MLLLHHVGLCHKRGCQALHSGSGSLLWSLYLCMILCYVCCEGQPSFPTPSNPSMNGSSPQHHQRSHSPNQRQHSPSAAHRSNGFAQPLQQQHQQDAPSTNGHDRVRREEQVEQHAEAAGQCVDALFGVLQQPVLPSTCLWHVGWLLSQLLAHAQSESSQLAPHQQTLLDQVCLVCEQPPT